MGRLCAGDLVVWPIHEEGMTRRAECATLSSKSNTAAAAIASVSRLRVLNCHFEIFFCKNCI